MLTTTANAEDILLVINMDNAERRDKREKHRLVAEEEGASCEMEAIQSESTENIASSLEYSEASLEVIENDSESHRYQVDENVAIESSSEQTEDIVPSDEDGLENISLTFKLSLNCNNGNVVCEIDSDFELEESDSEYTFTYEEVTDSECEDC